MQLNLPVEDKYNREDVIKIMKRDKKNKKGEVNFVMIEKIGKHKIVKIKEKGSLERTKKLLMQFNLPVEDKYNREDVIQIMKRDKKNKKGEVNFVMIEKIGKYKIVKVKENKMYDFLYKNR